MRKRSRHYAVEFLKNIERHLRHIQDNLDAIISGRSDMDLHLWEESLAYWQRRRDEVQRSLT